MKAQVYSARCYRLNLGCGLESDEKVILSVGATMDSLIQRIAPNDRRTYNISPLQYFSDIF
jgi:hypothetical protein